MYGPPDLALVLVLDPALVLVLDPVLVLTRPVLQVVYHEQHIQRFWERHRVLFPDAVLVGPEENLPEEKARTMAM